MKINDTRMTSTILSDRLIYKGRVFELHEEDAILPGGARGTWARIHHPGAVVVIAQDHDRSLLLIEQYRHSIRRCLLEFPAGTLDAGEEILTCAKRELAEEIGFGARQWIPLGPLFPTPGFCDELQHLFLARDLFPQRAECDSDEIIELRRMTRFEVESSIRDGRLCDAKSISIFTRALLGGYL